MLGFQSRVGGDWPRLFNPSDLIGPSFGARVAIVGGLAECEGLGRRCLLGTPRLVAVPPLGRVLRCQPVRVALLLLTVWLSLGTGVFRGRVGAQIWAFRRTVPSPGKEGDPGTAPLSPRAPLRAQEVLV